jgi:hypothetical protein
LKTEKKQKTEETTIARRAILIPFKLKDSVSVKPTSYARERQTNARNICNIPTVVSVKVKEKKTNTFSVTSESTFARGQNLTEHFRFDVFFFLLFFVIRVNARARALLLNSLLVQLCQRPFTCSGGGVLLFSGDPNEIFHARLGTDTIKKQLHYT